MHAAAPEQLPSDSTHPIATRQQQPALNGDKLAHQRRGMWIGLHTAARQVVLPVCSVARVDTEKWEKQCGLGRSRRLTHRPLSEAGTRQGLPALTNFPRAKAPVPPNTPALPPSACSCTRAWLFFIVQEEIPASSGLQSKLDMVLQALTSLGATDFTPRTLTTLRGLRQGVCSLPRHQARLSVPDHLE